jgi:hypothetical protein
VRTAKAGRPDRETTLKHHFDLHLSAIQSSAPYDRVHLSLSCTFEKQLWTSPQDVRKCRMEVRKPHIHITELRLQRNIHLCATFGRIHEGICPFGPRCLWEVKWSRFGSRNGFADGEVDCSPDSLIVRIVGERSNQDRLDMFQVNVVVGDGRNKWPNPDSSVPPPVGEGR